MQPSKTKIYMLYLGKANEAFAMIFDYENGQGEKVKERNKIRKKLRSSFETINVSVFPAPCKDLQDLDQDITSEEFKECVKKLKDTILNQMKQPRRFGTDVVNSRNVDFLVRTFVKELEDGNIVNVKSVLSQIQRGVVDEAKHCFEKNLIKAYNDINVPVTKGLNELLTKKRSALFDVFNKSTEKVDLEVVYRDDALEDLEHFADRQFDSKTRENQLEIQTRKIKQTEILATAVEEFRSEVENELKKDGEESTKMQQRLEKRVKEFVNNFLQKTGELIPVAERTKKLEEVESWANERLKEKVKAKQEAEEYAKKSEKQAHGKTDKKVKACLCSKSQLKAIFIF